MSSTRRRRLSDILIDAFLGEDDRAQQEQEQELRRKRPERERGRSGAGMLELLILDLFLLPGARAIQAAMEDGAPVSLAFDAMAGAMRASVGYESPPAPHSA